MNQEAQQTPGPERIDSLLTSKHSRAAFLRRLGTGGGLVLFGGVLGACGGGSRTGNDSESAASGTSVAATSPLPGSTVEGGTLVFGVDSMTGNLEPGIFATYADWMGIEMTARGLTSSDFATGEVKPALAESWEVSPDGQVYTFLLRSGLTFHDGNPVTAQDFERSWTRLVDSNDPSQAPGSFTAFSLLGVPVIKSFRAVDDLTFEVTLDGPDESFLARCSSIAGVVLSSKAIDEFGQEIGTNLVGCGPFRYSGYTQDQQAVFERFDGYYDGPPILDKVIFQIVPEPTALATALEAGSIHASNFNQLSSLETVSSTLPVEMGKPYQSTFCWLNAAKESLSDLRVRQAFNYAIDRETVIAAGINGWGVQPAYLGRGVGIGYDPSLELDSTQNLEKARALVQDAGAEGTEIYIISPNNRWWPAVGQIIEQNLESVGLKARMEYLDQAAFSAKQSAGEHDVALDSFTATIPDPDDAIRSVLYSPGFFSQAITGMYLVEDAAAKIDEMLVLVRQESDQEKRKALYLELQRIAIDEIMVIAMLAYMPAPVAHQTSVTGLDIDSLGCYHAFFEKVAMAG